MQRLTYHLLNYIYLVLIIMCLNSRTEKKLGLLETLKYITSYIPQLGCTNLVSIHELEIGNLDWRKAEQIHTYFFYILFI